MTKLSTELDRSDQLRALAGHRFGPDDPTPTGDIWDAAMGITLREERSNSEAANWKLATQPRNDKIDELIEAGRLTRGELSRFELGRSGYRPVEGQRDDTLTEDAAQIHYDYGQVADYIRRKGWDDVVIRDDEEIRQDQRQSLKALREADVATQAEAEGFWQHAAIFGASAAGAMTDPLNILATFVPMASGAKAGTFMAGALRAGGSAALANVGVEAVIQSQVFDYKQEIASPYEWSDALFNIGAAGALGGIIGGIGGGISAKLNAANNPRLVDEAIDARRVELDEALGGEPDPALMLSDAEADELAALRAPDRSRGTQDQQITSEHYWADLLAEDNAVARSKRIEELEQKQAYSELVNEKAQLDSLAEAPRFLPYDDEISPDDYATLTRQVEAIDDFEMELDDGAKVNSRAYAEEYDGIAEKLKELDTCMYGG